MKPNHGTLRLLNDDDDDDDNDDDKDTDTYVRRRNCYSFESQLVTHTLDKHTHTHTPRQHETFAKCYIFFTYKCHHRCFGDMLVSVIILDLLPPHIYPAGHSHLGRLYLWLFSICCASILSHASSLI